MLEAGVTPDPWQQEVLRCFDRHLLLNITRQGGKSFTVAATAIRTAVLEGPSLILILSKSLRQAAELFRAKLIPMYHKLGDPVTIVRETALQMELANGSRIISLPGHEETVRSFSSVRLLIIDEASRTPDVLFRSVRPMLAVSRGQMAALSTPWGKRGWFYKEATSDSDMWRRWKVPATRCPRIPKSFLAEELATHGQTWYNQEYGCSFEDTVDAVFAEQQILAAVSEDVQRISL